jgi:uncharacterized protein YycO
MLYNKISIIMPAATTTIYLVSIILSMSTFINISAFAQSEETNQTIQDAGQSANQTGEAIKQNVSDVITNISKGAKSLGSNITTEVAKEIADNIGKKLQDLAK